MVKRSVEYEGLFPKFRLLYQKVIIISIYKNIDGV